jgi:hypothetical protein
MKVESSALKARCARPFAGYGVYFGGQRICDVHDDIPAKYLQEHVVVAFPSGLQLNCRGIEVYEFRKGRQ